MKLSKNIRDTMRKHRLGAAEFSAKTGLNYNSCKNASAGKIYPVLDKLAPVIDFSLRHGFDRRDYEE